MLLLHMHIASILLLCLTSLFVFFLIWLAFQDVSPDYHHVTFTCGLAILGLPTCALRLPAGGPAGDYDY